MRKWWKDPTQYAIVSAKISAKLLGKPKKVTKKDFKTVFKNKFKKQPNGCWLWTRKENGHGYGQIYFRGKNYGAHRLSYILNKGKIESSELYVCHTCDNPLCINPDHLWLGTNHDNMIDMMKKGRGGISKLTEENKEEINKLYQGGYSIEDLAVKFNNSKGVIKFVAGVPY